MQQYQKAPTDAVLMDCALVSDYSSSVLWHPITLIVSTNLIKSCVLSRLLFNTDNRYDSELESCTFTPLSDITAVPQQYMVQMVTSVVPPSRLASFILCYGGCGDGVTLGESHYTLINVTDERYQFTVPVTWSTDSSSNTEHNYGCKMRFGGLADDGNGNELKIKSRDVTGIIMHVNS